MWQNRHKRNTQRGCQKMTTEQFTKTKGVKHFSKKKNIYSIVPHNLTGKWKGEPHTYNMSDSLSDYKTTLGWILSKWGEHQNICIVSTPSVRPWRAGPSNSTYVVPGQIARQSITSQQLNTGIRSFSTGRKVVHHLSFKLNDESIWGLDALSDNGRHKLLNEVTSTPCNRQLFHSLIGLHLNSTQNCGQLRVLRGYCHQLWLARFKLCREILHK